MDEPGSMMASPGAHTGCRPPRSVRRREVTGFEEDQIVVRVWYRDGTQDSCPTSGRCDVGAVRGTGPGPRGDALRRGRRLMNAKLAELLALATDVTWSASFSDRQCAASLRAGHRLHAAAAGICQAHRAASGDRLQARRDGHQGGGRPSADGAGRTPRGQGGTERPRGGNGEVPRGRVLQGGGRRGPAPSTAGTDTPRSTRSSGSTATRRCFSSVKEPRRSRRRSSAADRSTSSRSHYPGRRSVPARR